MSLAVGKDSGLLSQELMVLYPRLIVADEPSSALDMSIQAQILNLMKSLQKDMGMSYLFITHNLSAARFMCDRIAVMYLEKWSKWETVIRFLEILSIPTQGHFFLFVLFLILILMLSTWHLKGRYRHLSIHRPVVLSIPVAPILWLYANNRRLSLQKWNQVIK